MLPEAFLERMKVQLNEEYPDFLRSLERPRAVALRFNPLKGERPTLPFVGEPVGWEENGFYYDGESVQAAKHPSSMTTTSIKHHKRKYFINISP